MLKNIREIYGTRLAATDGEIGQVKDFYFDDETWAIRYLVVDTGAWLPGRLVLLAPDSLGSFDADEKLLSVNLTMDQIENSPSIESHRPVTRQFESDYYRYYNWPAYWDGGGIWSMDALPTLSPPLPAEDIEEPNDDDDVHLQSAKALEGYGIQARDGLLGSVTGFLVDQESWTIGEILVETGHWYAGKQIFISPATVTQVSYETSEIVVSLSMADLQNAAEDEIAGPGISQPLHED
jgi:hypothetical protein